MTETPDFTAEDDARVLARLEAAEEELARVREEVREQEASLRRAHEAEIAALKAGAKMLKAGNATLQRAIRELQNLGLRESE